MPSEQSDIVKAGTETEFADFVVHWDKDLKRQEASAVVEAAEKLLSTFNDAREFIRDNDNKRVRAWVRIGYPYIDPYFDFDVWYDEEAQGYGIHIYQHFTWNCYGSIHFRHQQNWI